MDTKVKFSIPFLTLVLIFSFALACTNNNGSSSTTKISEDSDKESIEAEVVENVAEEEVVEEGPVESDIEEKMIEENNDNSGAEIKYEIIYTLNNLRCDDAITYYVLIDPIDLSDDIFKDDIKEIIRNIVEEKGNKITIEIFDKRGSLENGYKDGKFEETTDLEGWDNWFTDEIANDLAIHSIATYDGELENWLFFNTLCFFMYSDYIESTVVDKYVENIEFNPSETK